MEDTPFHIQGVDILKVFPLFELIIGELCPHALFCFFEQQKYTDPATKQMLPDVLESCTGLEEILTIMTDCIAVHKTS